MWEGWPISRGFVSASVFVTSAGLNPTETVMAIAARTADHIIRKEKIIYKG